MSDIVMLEAGKHYWFRTIDANGELVHDLDWVGSKNYRTVIVDDAGAIIGELKWESRRKPWTLAMPAPYLEPAGGRVEGDQPWYTPACRTCPHFSGTKGPVCTTCPGGPVE